MFSSIFNFNYAHKYMALPPAKRRKHQALIITCGLAIVLFLVSRIAIRIYIYGEEYYPQPEATALTQDTKIVMLGSSHVQYGIDPRAFSKSVMNLGSGGLGAIAIEQLVKKHFHKLQDLETVFIEFDHVLFTRHFKHMGKDLYLLWRTGVEPWDIREHFNTKEYYYHFVRWLAEPNFLRFRLTIPQVWSQFIEREKHIPGYTVKDGTISAKTDGKSRVKGHYNQYNSYKFDWNLAINSYFRMVKMFSDRGIKVIFLRLPKHHTYMKAFPPLFDKIYNKAFERLSVLLQEEENFDFWDYTKLKTYEDELFYDGNHLNRKGNKVLSEIIAKKFSETQLN
ncbi:MAG: hypothetical protein BM556_08920 [Bacteriovorax sp. MedPE-SWde]|nr:MAG: hypothetical protein BM556_08920 [Bacteriovorax sp. MedPE-SWde]